MVPESLSRKERLLIFVILLLNAAGAVYDILGDASSGGSLAHVLREAITALLSLIGSYFILRKSAKLKKAE